VRAFLSVCVFLILAQSLIFGNLINLELPDSVANNPDLLVIQKQISSEPFVVPAGAAYQFTIQNRNDLPNIVFLSKFVARNLTACVVTEIKTCYLAFDNLPQKPPAFLLHSILRL